MMFYHIYFSKVTNFYEVEPLRSNLLGEYADNGDYYFAVFTRGTDAYNYVNGENAKLRR